MLKNDEIINQFRELNVKNLPLLWNSKVNNKISYNFLFYCEFDFAKPNIIEDWWYYWDFLMIKKKRVVIQNYYWLLKFLREKSDYNNTLSKEKSVDSLILKDFFEFLVEAVSFQMRFQFLSPYQKITFDEFVITLQEADSYLYFKVESKNLIWIIKKWEESIFTFELNKKEIPNWNKFNYKSCFEI